MGARTTKEIAEYICKTGYKYLPSEVVEYAKVLALSHIGANIAGSTVDFGRTVNLYIKGKNGHPEAGVFGAGFRTCADYAALANGNSSHATELEDGSAPEWTYTCGHWPAVFAMGEKLKLSGADIIEALVIGYEVAARLGLVFQTGHDIKGRSNAAACSTIGAAASAAKMLRLNVGQTTSALSLAASQAGGIVRQAGSGAHFVEAGFGGRNGICAAELAALGYTGQPDIFEGKRGFGDLWSDCPEFDLKLGEEYRLMRVSVKTYSCVGFTHRSIDGLLDLITEHNIAWNEVASIEHGLNYTRSYILEYDQPMTVENARFSLPHITVACFFDKKVFLGSFTNEKVNDPRWRDARKKVKVTVLPEVPGGGHDIGSPITITMKNGETYKKICHSSKGDPSSQRFGIADVMKKYLDCVDFASTFSRSRADQIAATVLGLDKLEDVSPLAALLTFPDQV